MTAELELDLLPLYKMANQCKSNVKYFSCSKIIVQHAELHTYTMVFTLQA